ncbi:MAG TPA: prepilin-type N-terminal cleavage/methylation domain-containing protein, partial [Marinagarivorans sp.]
MNTFKLNKRAAGFSLIELMVAMLIGLIVLNGVIRVVINSKRSYLDNQAVSQIQENARFALDILGREIKIAGYFGCMPLDGGEAESSVSDARYDGYLTSGGTLPSIEVLEGTGTSLPMAIAGDVVAGDVLIVRHTDPNREYMLLESLAKTADITTAAGDAIKDGEPVALVSPGCELANVFTWASADKPEGNFAKQNFTAGSRLSPVQVNAYYIGTSSVVTGMPALKREIILADGTTRSEELALGVSNMTLQPVNVSGTDVNIENAGTNLDDTRAIRITLTLQSHSKVNPVETNDEGTVTDNGFIEQTALATVR